MVQTPTSCDDQILEVVDVPMEMAKTEVKRRVGA